MKVNLSALRQRITVQHLHCVEDGLGGFQEEWRTISRLWAYVNASLTHRQAKVSLKGIPLSASGTYYRVVVRYSMSSLPPDKQQPSLWETPLRILWRRRVLIPITTPEIDEKHKWVNIVVKEASA